MCFMMLFISEIKVNIYFRGSRVLVETTHNFQQLPSHNRIFRTL